MALTTRDSIFQNMAKGLGFTDSFNTIGPGSTTTAAAAASGNLTIQLYFNRVGTTLPTTLIGLQIPPAPNNSILSILGVVGGSSAGKGLFLVRLYQLGTVDLTATGDKLTHDGATFPVTRTQLGVASQPLGLIPILYVTTATSVTAPVVVLKTAVGGAGYTNQDGTAVVGTASFTFPAAATTINSAFVLQLEDGDSAIQDISALQVTTASTTGAATLFGAEILMPLGKINSGTVTTYDALFGGLGLTDLVPAVKTGGTALTSYLVIMSVGSTTANAAGVDNLMIKAVNNV